VLAFGGFTDGGAGSWCSLVKERYLLNDDVETSLTFAARLWDAFAR
jgi:hypothetical protein